MMREKYESLPVATLRDLAKLCCRKTKKTKRKRKTQ